VAGALDPTGLERARAVAAGIPGARLEVIGDAGHAPHLETPDTFIRTTDDFLSASCTTA
jgi:pimeloyl-ACP methyl ester carboxylesterase